MERRIYMSEKELSRIQVFKEILEKRLKISKAAKQLGLSSRQVKRLKKRFKAEGAKGLISKKIGLRGNRQIPQEQRKLVLEFLGQRDHWDFGPTLVHEYLVKSGSLTISLSTVRSIMFQNGLWSPKKVRNRKVYALRPRRPRKGELVQLDGSEHDWFEGRGPRCTLLVYVDDATSETLQLKFVKSESTFDYFQATREYIEKCGKPEAFYPDKHSVFKVNYPGALSGDGRTQFSRAMEELGIELICANSPQAKGRVERRNRDFQNRLVKAMRIAKICTIEAANAFLPQFLDDFNQKFAKAPQDPRNAHRPLSKTHNLDRIFCIKYKRRLSKSLTLQYDNVIYQVVVPKERAYTLRKAQVEILETQGGKVIIEYQGKPLTVVPYNQMQSQVKEVSAKELVLELTERVAAKVNYKPSRKHPWKKRGGGLFKPSQDLMCC